MSEVASPCVRNCCLDEQEICLGCLRSIDEICQWGKATDERKREILVAVEERRVERNQKRLL